LAECGGGSASLQVFKGLKDTAIARGEHRAALALADQMLEIAHRGDSALALVTAHYAQALPRHNLGELAGARQHFLQAMEHYREEDFRGKPIADDGVNSRIFAGHNEWVFGYPDRAVRYVEEAISIACRQNNPFEAAFAIAVGSQVYKLRRDYRRVLEANGEAVRLGIASEFPYINAVGKIRSAWARAQMGDTGNAVDQIQEGLAELNVMKFYSSRTSYLAGLSETQAATGAVDEALVTVEQALQTNPDELIYRPEVLRLRGELRLRTGAGSKAQFGLAEQDFGESIELARSMGAKSWELRATTSLARLLAEQGNPDEARTMLADIYNWFTEGFDTLDLKEAKTLLDELLG
jgi:tetratricopeptide (TPR) repeat protein